MIALGESHLHEMVYGGAVLGGGGGGSIEAGLTTGRKALAAGTPSLLIINELPKDAQIVTVSRIGTVSGKQNVDRLDAEEFRALQILARTNPDLRGIIPSEIGPLAVTYGWGFSARTGIPLVDAPCNGRAHPLGMMGSLGLHRFPGYLTSTIAVGGTPKAGNYLELKLKTNVSNADQIVRNSVVTAGVALACVRNPLPARYVSKHAALGALKMAQQIGREFLRHHASGFDSVLRALSRKMCGRVLFYGIVSSVNLRESKGYSLGSIELRTGRRSRVIIPVCNEYMMVFRDHAPLAVFPDLITLFEAKSGAPLSSGEVRTGQTVTVFGVPRKFLVLGSPMRDRNLLRRVEKLLNMRFPPQGMKHGVLYKMPCSVASEMAEVDAR